MGELEVVDGVGSQMFYCHRYRVGVEEQFLVFWGHGSSLDHVIDVFHQMLVIVVVHEDYGKPVDLFRLDQRHRFKEFVKGAEPAGHNDEAIGVLEKEHFADEEVPNVDGAIEVGIGFLFEGKFDIDSNASTANVFGAAIGSFHDPRSTAGHDCESKL